MGKNRVTAKNQVPAGSSDSAARNITAANLINNIYFVVCIGLIPSYSLYQHTDVLPVYSYMYKPFLVITYSTSCYSNFAGPGQPFWLDPTGHATHGC